MVGGDSAADILILNFSVEQKEVCIVISLPMSLKYEFKLTKGIKICKATFSFYLMPNFIISCQSVFVDFYQLRGYYISRIWQLKIPQSLPWAFCNQTNLEIYTRWCDKSRWNLGWDVWISSSRSKKGWEMFILFLSYCLKLHAHA